MSMFYAPKIQTPFHFLSLGGGVQSSCLALMAAKGEVTPMPQAAIFADTQAEPAGVYKWMEWLKVELSAHFPVHTVTRGCLTTESVTLRDRVTPSKYGRTQWVKSLIPAFVLNPNGSKGILGRQCTYNYKIEEIGKFVRKAASIKRGQKSVTVTQWLGISADEKQRMKNAIYPWQQNRWPLVELGMSRKDCLVWMDRNGYPTPPRSACIYCPFHSDGEWRTLAAEEPESFHKAVQFEKDLQRVHRTTDNLGGVPYLHSGLIPLDQVKFRTDTDPNQHTFGDWTTEGMLNECEGMCGM